MADAVKRNKIFNADVIFAFFTVGILFILLFPLPQIILSLLLVLNVSISLLLLLLIFYIKKSLEISAYPTILLVLTLFRLALNVATTKLILLEGNAGSVVEAFGRFVIGNNYIVGAVIFLILVVINFIVIVKGSSRIAEVAARFTLDAMPGKQMSIDSDLNAGIIDEAEAKRKREDLSKESEFYGAMDGASKFVTGDAIAGIVITVINILGGIALGVIQLGMPLVEAMQRYTILTIGDGLLSQIPALLISVSAGMLVSKTAYEGGGTGAHLFTQFFSRHEPLFICGVMLLIIAVLPGFPFIPFIVMATLSFAMGSYIMNRRKEAEATAAASLSPVGGKGGKGGDMKALPEGGAKGLSAPADNELPKVNPMTLEVGFSLVSLVDPNQDGDLVDRISLIRKQVKEEMGFLIPPISIQDNISLGNNEYRILVRGLERARGMVHPGSHLAINPGDATGRIEGMKTKDPAFGFDAIWIAQGRVDAAEAMGYTVVDASSVITTHVTKVVKDYASDLLTRQDVSNMLEKVKQSNETVVSELVPGLLSIGVIHRVLQKLLDEHVPIHDLPAILEVLSDYASQTRDPVILCEFARQALKGHIISRFLGEDRTLYCITLDPRLEEEIQTSISQGAGGGIMTLAPERALEIIESIRNVFNEASSQSGTSDVVLLASPLIRLHLFRMIERKIDNLAVLSYSEISDDVPLKVLGTVRCSSKGKIAA